MTTKYAEALIDSSERKIITSYSQFYASAVKLRDEGLAGARQRTMLHTLLPLILCVIGLLIFRSAWFGGLCLIIGGIALAAKLHQNAADEERSVENAARTLENALNEHQKI